MASYELILNLFPRKFSSNFDTLNNPQSAGALLTRLWENVKLSFEEDCGQIEYVCHTHVDGLRIKLPSTIPENGCANGFAEYLQEIMDLNKIDLVVILNHQDDLDDLDYSFELLTPSEFEARIEFPKDEYRAEMGGVSIVHPNMRYTWIWVSKRIGKMFPPGDVRDFPQDSIAYRAAFGTEMSST